MRAIKLTQEQYIRSLKSNLSHEWVMDSASAVKPTRNSIFSRYSGPMLACIVSDGSLSDYDIKKIFGPTAFIDGPVSPGDKDCIPVDVFYIKR
jgi:hypothetical protein